MKRRTLFHLGILSSIGLLTGCKNKVEKIKEESFESFLDSLKDNISYFEKKEHNKTDKPLLFFVGPSLALSKEDYKIISFSEEDLLFSGYGILNMLPIYLKGDIDKLNKKAKTFGYNNIKEMFLSLYSDIKYKKEEEIILLLKKLNILEEMSAVEIRIFSDKLVYLTYQDYYKYEKKQNFKIWNIGLNNKKINFSKEEYLHSFFILYFIEKLFKENKEK